METPILFTVRSMNGKTPVAKLRHSLKRMLAMEMPHLRRSHPQNRRLPPFRISLPMQLYFSLSCWSSLAWCRFELDYSTRLGSHNFQIFILGMVWEHSSVLINPNFNNWAIPFRRRYRLISWGMVWFVVTQGACMSWIHDKDRQHQEVWLL